MVKICWYYFLLYVFRLKILVILLALDEVSSTTVFIALKLQMTWQTGKLSIQHNRL